MIENMKKKEKSELEHTMSIYMDKKEGVISRSWIQYHHMYIYIYISEILYRLGLLIDWLGSIRPIIQKERKKGPLKRVSHYLIHWSIGN